MILREQVKELIKVCSLTITNSFRLMPFSYIITLKAREKHLT